MLIRASLVLFLLLAAPLISTAFARRLRIGAFNIQVFGKSKVAKDKVLDILVKVLTDFTKCIISMLTLKGYDE